MSDAGPAVLVIVGPTAVGKTEIALRLAQELAAEIVSLDSRQLYRGMDIGTAKPSAGDRRRIRHHLVDVADPHETWSLSQVQDAAYGAMREALDRGRLPILVGGTGQYVRAVVEGWRIPRVAPDGAFRERMRSVASEEGERALHARLAALDPEAAASIDPRNVRRVIRALEVCVSTGRRFSELRARAAPPFAFSWIGLRLPLDVLDARIDRRVEAMLRCGLEGEVRGLLEAGYGFDLPSMSGLGYVEWRERIHGEADVAEVAEAIGRHTRRFARRQAAWFRQDDPRIAWFDLSIASYADIRAHAAAAIGV